MKKLNNLVIKIGMISSIAGSGCVVDNAVGSNNVGSVKNNYTKSDDASFKLSQSNTSQAIPFIDDWKFKNNLTGNLKGMVLFAQDITMNPDHDSNNLQNKPDLTPDRNALFIFVPEDNQIIKPYSIDVVENNLPIKTYVLNTPEKSPALDQNLKSNIKVSFSNKAFTVKIPYMYMHKGVSFIIKDQNNQNQAKLSAENIDFGPAHKLVMHNTRIGIFTAYAESTQMEKNLAINAANYFNTIPVSQLTVSNYSPVRLDRIVYPDGRIYTKQFPDSGDVYNGIGEHFTREFLDRAILLANGGYMLDDNTTNWEPFAQRVGNSTVAMYNNGIVMHGLHATWVRTFLINWEGNEFSHEFGHTYGLHDYDSGVLGGHKHTDGFMYDDYNNILIAPIDWNTDTPATVLDEPPFLGKFNYGKDAMSGGSPNGSVVSNYTFYSANSLKKIQNNFASARILSDDGTKFLKYDPTTQQMLNSTSPTDRIPLKSGIDVITIYGIYDPESKIADGGYIYPAMYSNYGNIFKFPEAESGGCNLTISFNDGSIKHYNLPKNRIHQDNANMFAINIERSLQPKKVSIYCPISSSPLTTLDIKSPDAEPTSVTIGTNHINNLPLKLVTDSSLIGFTTFPRIIVSFNQSIINFDDTKFTLLSDTGNVIPAKFEQVSATSFKIIPINPVISSSNAALRLSKNIEASSGSLLGEDKVISIVYRIIPPISLTSSNAGQSVLLDMSLFANYLNKPGSGERLGYFLVNAESQLNDGSKYTVWDTTSCDPTINGTLLNIILTCTSCSSPVIYNTKIQACNDSYFLNSLANYFLSNDNIKLSLSKEEYDRLPNGKYETNLHLGAYFWNNNITTPIDILLNVDKP